MDTDYNVNTHERKSQGRGRGGHVPHLLGWDLFSLPSTFRTK